MSEPMSYSAEKALAEALSNLQTVEEENLKLQSKLKQLSKDAFVVERAEGAGGSEMRRLQKQIKELMHVNNQWDLEFKELDEAFRRYRIDSQQAQEENQSMIAKLKDTKESNTEEIRELQIVISRKDRDVTELRSKVRMLEDEVRGSVMSGSRYGRPMVSRERVKELEEESQMLRQQLKAYQDDFDAERKDRERMNEEKEGATIRYEAEMTSLKLQLERCRNELAHFTAEANRLSQQLRLKSQVEEEQYKRHLESNGYITRSPSGHMTHLPPLDPFVEIDVEGKDVLAARLAPVSLSPRLLTRGVDLVNAYSNSQGAQAYSNTQKSMSRSDSQDSERSRSPIMKNGTGSSYIPSSSPGPTHRSASPIATTQTNTATNLPNRLNGFKPSIPPSMNTNTSSAVKQLVYPPPHRHNGDVGVALSNAGYGVGVFLSNGVLSSNGYVNVDELSPSRRSNAPPLETKGRYSCPRCERKFENKRDCTDHKTRCVV